LKRSKIAPVIGALPKNSPYSPSGRLLEEWSKFLSDVPTAGAILDRFLHHF
jgi:hypothetical protein